MREHGAFGGHELGAEGTELAAVGDVLVVEPLGESDDCDFDLGDRGVGFGELVVNVADLADAPEEVDRGGTRGGEVVADRGDLGG